MDEKTIARLEALVEKALTLQTPPAPVETPAPPADVTKTANVLTDDDRERMAAVNVSKSHNERQEELWAHADRLQKSPGLRAFEFERRTATPEGKAMQKFIQSGQIPTENKVLVEGTPANGGYAVPALYSMDLVQPLVNQSYLRAAGARILSVSGTNSFNVPALTYTAAATIGAESSAYVDATPPMAQITFAPYKLRRLSLVTEEEASDSRFDVWGNILQPDFVQSFSEGENNYFTTGTGTSQPQGLVAGATGVTTLATGNTLTISADNLVDLYGAVDYKYRRLPSTAWMMSDGTLKYIRKLKDTTGRYLVDYTNAFDGGQIATLFGWPVIINNTMAAIGVSAKTVVFGAFQYYWIADFGQLELQRLNERYADVGQIGFRAYRRVDAHIMLQAAFAVLQQSAT